MRSVIVALVQCFHLRRTVISFVLVSLLIWIPLLSAQEKSQADLSQQASAQFDLSRLGYVEPSDMARRSDAVNLSLDFLDRDHILFTFNPKKLFTRDPACPATHDDRMMRAVVVDVKSGEVQAQADWYLHDARRYLWNLGSGRILLRRLNSFFVVDRNLQEKILWTSPKELLWVSVTPDGKQVIAETEDATGPTSKGKPAAKRAFGIEFRDLDSFQLQRAIRSEKAANVESTSSGFASVIPGGLTGTVWLVRFGPSEKERVNIARVRTRRAPDVIYLSNNAMLIGRDSTRSPGYSVSAFTVTGSLLWRQHWNAHRYYPILARSEDGSRFAINTLRLVDTSTADLEFEGLEQRIEVFDTATGTPVMSTLATPVVLQGHNFSLSSDGSRLAVLQGAKIDFYDLRAMTSEEQAKYTAVKADVPGLYIAPVDDRSQPEDSETAFTSADSQDEKQTSPTDSQLARTPSVASAADDTQAKKSSDLSQPLATSPSPSTLVTLKSRAQAVALDVVVTDPKGHTVKAVPRSDFLVREDGKLQTLSYFNEMGTSTAPAAVPEQKEVATNIFTNASPSPESAVTVILYDLLNTTAQGQQRAKLELLKFLENKPKESRFALCVLSERLQMVQGFTPDESLLIKAAKAQKGSLRNTSLRSQDLQDQQTISWLMQSSQTATSPMAMTLQNAAGQIEQEEARRQGRDLNTRAWLTMDAFTQLARYLAAIPGRKSLIWISGSFPLGIFPGLELKNTDATTTSYTEQVKQAVNLLAESHIAVYPVDVRGLTADSLLSQGLSLADAAPPQLTVQPSSNLATETRLQNLQSLNEFASNGASPPGSGSPYMQEMSEHGIMDKIATDTGGKAFYNSNGIGQAMSLALEEQTNYYALSYIPTNKKFDGKFRRIKVALAPSERKLHVIHRSGYFAVDPDASSGGEKDVSRGFGLAAMQHGSPQAHQVYFEARVIPIGKTRKVILSSARNGAAAKKKKHQGQDARPPEPIEVQHYVVDYAVAPSQVRLDLNPDGAHHGIVNFMTTSFDDDGTVRTGVVSRAVTDLDPEGFKEALAGGLRLRQQVDVPVKAAWLRLGVQDALTGHLGTLELPLPVKPLPGVEQSLAQRMPEIEPD